MALNSLGLGFTFEAEDLASPVIDKVAGKISGLEAKAERAKKRFAGSAAALEAGVALVGQSALILAPAISAARSYGKAMAEVATLVDEATFPQAKLNKIVQDATLAFGGAPEEQAAALYNIISAGASDAAAANEQLLAANKLAIGGQTDANTAVLGLSKSLANFGGTATEAGDSFFTAVKRGQLTVGELASALPGVAVAAADAGLNLDTTNAVLAQLSTKLPTVSEGSNALKAALSGIASPTGDAAKEAKHLGIEFSKTALKSKGIIQFLKEIKESENFSDNTLSRLFGSTEAQAAIGGIMADFEGLESILGDMENKAGSLDTAFEKMNNTLDQQAKRLVGQKNLFLGMIGDAILPLATAVLDVVETMGNAFGNLDEDTKDLIAGAIAFSATFTGAIGAVLAAVGGIGLVVPAITAGLASIKALAISIAPSLLPVAGIVAALAGAALILKTAWDQNLGGIQDRVSAFASKVTFFFSAIGQLLKDGVLSGDVLEKAIDPENAGVVKLLGSIVQAATRVKKFVTGVWEGLTATFTANEAVFTGLQDAVGELFGVFTELFGGLGDMVGGPSKEFSEFGKGAGSVIGNVVAAVANLLTVAVKFGKGFVKGVIDTFKMVKPIASDMLDIIGGVIKDFFNLSESTDAVGESSGFVTKAAEFLGRALGFLQTYMIVPLFKALRFGLKVWSFTTKAVFAIIRAVQFLIKVGKQVVAFFRDDFTGVVSKAFEKVKSVAMGVVQAIKGFFSGLWDSLRSGLDNMLRGVAELGDKLPKALQPQALQDFIQRQRQGSVRAPDPNAGRANQTINQGQGSLATGPVGLASASLPPPPPPAPPVQSFETGKSDKEVFMRMMERALSRPVVVKVGETEIAKATQRGMQSLNASAFGSAYQTQEGY